MHLSVHLGSDSFDVGEPADAAEAARLLLRTAAQLRERAAELRGYQYPTFCVAVWKTSGWGRSEGDQCGALVTHDFPNIIDLPLCEHHLRRVNRSIQTLVAEERQRRASESFNQRLAEAAERKSRSVVYFVERDGFIKIGITTQLQKRLKALSRGGQMPDGMTVGPVKLLATMPGGRSNEAYLHGCFDKHRIPGTEWFLDSPELRDFIAGLGSRSALEAA